jgi:hypothetical protein
MAAPNVVSVGTITGKTDVTTAVGTTATAVVQNGALSEVYKVNSLLVSNILASAVTVTVDLLRSATAYTICKDISLPVGATLDVLNNSIYLEENDDLRVTCDTASGLDVVASYEIIKE